MCLAQGPQGSDASEAATSGPSVSELLRSHEIVSYKNNLLIQHKVGSLFLWLCREQFDPRYSLYVQYPA